jgi:hypothetical protein
MDNGLGSAEFLDDLIPVLTVSGPDKHNASRRQGGPEKHPETTDDDVDTGGAVSVVPAPQSSEEVEAPPKQIST